MQWSRGEKQTCLGGEKILEFSLPPWEKNTSSPGKARGAFTVRPCFFHTHPGWSRMKPRVHLAGLQAGRALCTQQPCVPGLWAVGWCGSPQPHGS